MARSEWACCVWLITDTLVVDYSVPSRNATRRIAYCPPIAVSLFLLTVLVSYIASTLCGCGQLWPNVGMGWLGSGLHWDCNVIGDIAIISHRVHSSCMPNAILSLLIIPIIPSRQIYVAIDNPSVVSSVVWLTSSYLRQYVRAADDVSHNEYFHTNHRLRFSHLYQFRDGILVPEIFRYCSLWQG